MKFLKYLRFHFLIIITSSSGLLAQSPLSTPDNIAAGNCLDFDGVTNSALVNNNALWNNTFAGPDKQFTLSCWIRMDVDPTGSYHIIEKTGDNSCVPNVNERQVHFLVRQNLVSFVYYNNLSSTSIRAIDGSTLLQQGVWYHIAAVYDGTIDSNDGLDRVTIYVNGKAETTTMRNSQGTLNDIDSGPAPLAIASRWASGNVRCAGGEFNGQIDEVRIWNTLRTQNEIRNEMCIQLTGSEAGLVGYWNMNEGSGNTVNDLTSNNNHWTRQ